MLAEVHLPNGKQLSNFLQHLITKPKEKYNVPIFYGIPKIHKEPVKMRPIMPCHSAVVSSVNCFQQYLPQRQ